LLTTVTGGKVTYATSTDGTCQTATFQYSSSDSGTSDSYVVYVVNDATTVDYTYTVADWEDSIADSHSSLLTDNGWDRYLDTHLGFVYSCDETECDAQFDRVATAITENGDFSYALRATSTSGYGTHFYTGTAGVKSWEFNLASCDFDDYPDICGCVSSNNDNEYYVDGVLSVCDTA